tara:strand:- start:135 stop:347 length:213 start_codon:yes stop_codon:yes gene_type:complete
MDKDKLDTLNMLVRDLLWDYERLSTGGQETLHKILNLLGYSEVADEFTDSEELNDLEKIISAELKKTKVS